MTGGVALLCWWAVASAQVNVENLSAGARPEGTTVNASVGTALSRGNIDLLDIQGTLGVVWKSRFADGPGERPWMKDRFVANVHGGFRSFSGQVIVDERFAHVSYGRMLIPRLGIGVVGQVLNDRFRLLDWRVTGGVGLRWVGVNTPRLQLWGSVGYVAEWEDRAIPEGFDDPRYMLNHRWGVSVSWNAVLVPERLTWTNTMFPEVRFDDPSDVEFLNETLLNVAVTSAFAFQTGLRLRLDSRPPAVVEPLDLMWHTGFNVRWFSTTKTAEPTEG